MISKRLADIREKALSGEGISRRDALSVLGAKPGEVPELFAAASAVRRRFFGDRVTLCSIVNAKSGACTEDCAFCAQSSRHRARADVFPLRGEAEILQAARRAASLPIDRLGIVTSGGALSGEGIERVAGVFRSRAPEGIGWCASLGTLSQEELAYLKEAGLTRFHHNLETAESFFPKICSTHSFRERLATVRAAKAVGLEVCAGGILGLGESLEERVDLAFTLAAERVDSIPLNFLIPVPGTPLENLDPMKPLDILKTTAMFRFANPRSEIKICAGRLHLRDLQSMIFYAGATGMMIGPLLTVAGRDPEADRRMLADLGLEPGADSGRGG